MKRKHKSCTVDSSAPNSQSYEVLRTHTGVQLPKIQ